MADHDERIERVLDVVVAWANTCEKIRGLALVGSRAHGSARADSDIDLIVLVTDREAFCSDTSWLEAIGWESIDARPVSWRDAQYGNCAARHVLLENAPEVEFGIVQLSWADCCPVDTGTREVVAGGCRVLYDPDARLGKLIARCSGSAYST
jgi:hypothetical protein